MLRWLVDPMRAASVTDLPAGRFVGELVYQPKWDGFRALAWATAEGVILQSRHGRDLTRYFPKVQESRQTGARERAQQLLVLIASLSDGSPDLVTDRRSCI